MEELFLIVREIKIPPKKDNDITSKNYKEEIITLAHQLGTI